MDQGKLKSFTVSGKIYILVKADACIATYIHLVSTNRTYSVHSKHKCEKPLKEAK
jgi:hypothetical protein